MLPSKRAEFIPLEFPSCIVLVAIITIKPFSIQHSQRTSHNIVTVHHSIFTTHKNREYNRYYEQQQCNGDDSISIISD